MRALCGIINIAGIFAAASLILPLLGFKIKLMPDEWIYTTEHFIVAGILTGLGIICGIILFTMKKPEAK
jgi:putative Mn2+ efflux pump MntP